MSTSTLLHPTESLLRRGGLTWAALAVGLDNGWVDRRDIAQTAAEWLSANPERDIESAVLLAACEEDDLDDIRRWLAEANAADADESEAIAMDRWRWAFLNTLADDDKFDDETKLERLQELYAAFDYPEDMAACSPYYIAPPDGDTGEGPRGALRRVVDTLERRLF